MSVQSSICHLQMVLGHEWDQHSPRTMLVVPLRHPASRNWWATAGRATDGRRNTLHVGNAVRGFAREVGGGIWAVGYRAVTMSRRSAVADRTSIRYDIR
jgi:hypothetical protein